jgi:hypothetical protein
LHDVFVQHEASSGFACFSEQFRYRRRDAAKAQVLDGSEQPHGIAAAAVDLESPR